jgi:hypothetical protein
MGSREMRGMSAQMGVYWDKWCRRWAMTALDDDNIHHNGKGVILLNSKTQNADGPQLPLPN